MLVLSRKAGESLMVGDDVVIKVHEIGKNKIKLAIQAPTSVSIRRGESKRVKE